MDLRELAGFYDEHTQRCRREVRAWCAERALAVPDGYFDATLPNLMQTLFDLSHKVLVAQYQVIQSKVSFEEYCAALRTDEVRAHLANRYPVMARWISTATDHWVRQNCLLLERLERDADALRAMLGGGPLRIAEVAAGLGDTHRGGASVARIRFTDGRQLIYKPRSLAIDVHFGALVDWLNGLGELDLRVPRVLDRGDYGWVEFIAHAPCADAAEVDAYYRRLGAWLALLYVLEGSDFHYENIIAAGSHPVLIDLESFFHPDIGIANGAANENFDNSVLRTGILPSRIDLDAAQLPDISGMADPEGQQGVFERLFMVPGEDGRPRFERQKGVMAGAANIPLLDGRKVETGARHAPALQQGFRAMYAVLLTQRDTLPARLATFADDQVRVLFRNTVAYAHLLDEATHPSLLCSEEAAARHFGLLNLAVPQFPAAARFVPFEEADLQRRDVPLFSTRAASRDLWYSDEGCLPGFFASSGMERVHAKLARLSPGDMEHQCWIIAKTLAMDAGLRAPATASADDIAPGDYADAGRRHERLLREAERVGDYICAQVHETAIAASWVIVKPTSLDNRKMELVPAFYDLYSGMPGEILYLTQLARLTGKASYAALARKALHTLFERIGADPGAIRPLGLFIGWGGILHMLNTLAATEPALAPLVRERIDHYLSTVDFETLIQEDRAYALLKGTAGFMLACAELHRSNGSARALQLANLAGVHLLAQRCADTAGYSWRITSKVPLSGMAHGAAGIAMAFGRLYAASGEARWEHACLETLAYERTLFVPEQRNWRDCRDIATSNAAGPSCELAWAHGAPGIGLARVALLRDGIRTAAIEEDLENAVRTTLAAGLKGPQSLIYGSCGRLELLLCCREFVAPALAAQCETATGELLRELDTHGWQLGERHFHPLGLMAGVTGIGYAALRAAFPDRVPGILMGESGAPAEPDCARAA